MHCTIMVINHNWSCKIESSSFKFYHISKANLSCFLYHYFWESCFFLFKFLPTSHSPTPRAGLVAGSIGYHPYSANTDHCVVEKPPTFNLKAHSSPLSKPNTLAIKPTLFKHKEKKYKCITDNTNVNNHINHNNKQHWVMKIYKPIYLYIACFSITSSKGY